jgi:23S rRNA (adenine1618-N6)-methyltransferase
MATLPVSRDIYTRDVDFTALALQFPDFAKRLKSNQQLDFSDPESVRQLTKALLKRDLDLSIELPEDRLCPPVPNRFNYVLWIQDLLDSTSDDFRERYDPTRKVIGLDMSVEHFKLPCS